MKIRMLKTVYPDLQFVIVCPPGTVLKCGQIYEATVSASGAVCGICVNGRPLGVKPDEFERVE